MTVLLSCGRTVSKQVLPRSQLLTRLATIHPSLRVSSANGRDSIPERPHDATTRFSGVALPFRTYATAARPVGRPKAHTGRTTAKRTTTKTTATPTTKKAAPKRAAAKPKPKPKRKVKAKAKVKPKPKPRKRVLSAAGEARKAATERTALKKKALLFVAPKQLPASAWAVCFSQNAPKKGERVNLDGSSAKRASQAFKTLSPEEHERLNIIASENKAKNEAAYKRWLSSYTPLQIKEANNARDQLKRDAKASGKKATRLQHLKDDRLVKQPANPYAMFVQDRVASGDMRGMKVSEYGRLLGREFKEMSASEKKAYEDRYAVGRNRYIEEFKTVYGYDSPSANAAAAA